LIVVRLVSPSRDEGCQSAPADAFADPDGYVWNNGYSAQGKDQPNAE
jgi:hypothetical protein